VSTPTDPWDARGWLCYLLDWKDDWPSPGGLTYDSFLHRFMLSVVPDGWIKSGYGPTAQGKRRQDIGKGHAAFLRMSDLFDSLAGLAVTGNGQEIQISRNVDDCFFKESINAILSDDARFFSDFWEAVQHWRDCVKTGAPLLRAKNRRLEFMILATILEEGEPFYAVKSLRKLILRKFFPDQCTNAPTWKDIDQVVTRLGIKKCRRN
jgi:hypothetical protein